MALLKINGLTLDFASRDGSVRALDGVSFEMQAGETFCLVGESGSGKTITALSIAQLVPTPPAQYASGEILLNGENVLRMSPFELRKLRGGVVSYVFQEPAASLNPVLRIGRQIKESLKLHRPETATDTEVLRLLKLVGISGAEDRINEFPFRLSGGMQQRVMLAMALACRPKLLVADEPTTALDVTIQAQILELLKQLKTQFGMATLLITHNFGIVADIADRVGVMYGGQIVETAATQELLRNPLHPYTRALLNSVPRLRRHSARLANIQGTVPSLAEMPRGCRFAPRCLFRTPTCWATPPELRESSRGHSVRCPYAESLPRKNSEDHETGST